MKMTRKVRVCCWQETPPNFLVAERWSHCFKTQNETEHWSFARYFPRRSYPENLHLFLHVLRFFSSSKKRLRGGHEIALRGKFPGGSYHEQKGSSFATVVFFPPRTLTPLTGDKYFLFWFFKTFLWQYRGFDARKFLLNLFFANYVLICFWGKIIFEILNFSLLFYKIIIQFWFLMQLVNGNTMNIIRWDCVKSKFPTSSLL